jgi:bacterioferritin-associated ferredoxin
MMMDANQEIICYCKQVTKREVELAIQNGAKTLKDIQEITGACTGNQCKEMNPKGICCSVDILPMLPQAPIKCSCCCS